MAYSPFVNIAGAHPRRQPKPFTHPADLLRLHRALTRTARTAGERLKTVSSGSWEFRSQNDNHLWSRHDLEATALMVRYIPDFFTREGLKLLPGFENEEVPLVPMPSADNNGMRFLRLVIDPIDGSKSFDNAKCPLPDCPLPEPASAISIAAVCPVLGEIVASAVYCFDLGEVFSSLYLGQDERGESQYAAFRNDTLLRPMADMMESMPRIEAKRRVLNCTYNSRALQQVARLDLALMDRGLKAGYGGLTGSTAMDILNVVRGSFAASIDIRGLCRAGGSVAYWYDAAGALPTARGRGLRVITVGVNGQLLQGGDHPIRMPLALVVARSDVADEVVGAIRSVVPSAFQGHDSGNDN